MSGAATGIIYGLFMIGVLVVIHEFGHFVVAKFFKVGVPVFSIGMGPRLWGFAFRGTDFRISLLPVGGYVKMSGADPFGEEDPDAWVDPEDDFMRKPVWQRLLIMVAGPAANLILPFVLYTGAMMLGEPQPDNEVGAVHPGSLAEAAGLRPGDDIVAVDDASVDTWIEFIEQLDDRVGDQVAITVQRASVAEVIDLQVAESTKSRGFFDEAALGIGHALPSAILGVPYPDSPAGRAGLETADVVTAVDGRPVATWYELTRALSTTRDHVVDVIRADTEQATPVRVTLTGPRSSGGDPLRMWGIEYPSVYVGRVEPESAADEAGVLAGDRLVRIDDTELLAWFDVIGAVVATLGDDGEPRPLDLQILRHGKLLTLNFTPRVKRELLGAEPHFRPVMGVLQYSPIIMSGDIVNKRYGLFEAVPRATDQGGRLFREMMKMLGNLFTGKVKPQESVGGPVEIIRQAKASAEAGVFAYVRMMGMISISLGIINLLPVPVLDGGQILFYTIEGVRGRPLPLVLRERIQMVGVLALMALMLTVTVMDVSRLFGG